MTDRKSSKTATRRPPWFVDRAMDIAAAIIIIVVACLAASSAVLVLKVAFSGEQSSTIAAWVQAIGVPFAIGVAYFAAKHQASEARNSALDILKNERHERKAAGIERERREIRAAHNALLAMALVLRRAYRSIGTNDADYIDLENVEFINSNLTRLRFFQSPHLEADVESPITGAVVYLDGLTKIMRSLYANKSPSYVARKATLQAARAVMVGGRRLEREMQDLLTRAAVLGVEAKFKIRLPIHEWEHREEWETLFKQHDIAPIPAAGDEAA